MNVSAAEELMDKNAHVQAIISPQTSPQGQAELFAGMAQRGNIPILSTSTTALASTSRFLVGTAPNTSSQAAPIAAILEAFAWRAAVLLHEDSPYGVGILSALVHAFQGSRVLTDSVAVASDATNSRLDSALLAVKSMPTRVYIVHMPPALAARLFGRAVVAGMMSEGYVWIATAGVGNAVDGLANHGDVENMQGVVSLLPHVLVTEQIRSFSRRIKVKLRQESPDDDPSTPVWQLRLYDMAWAAATAAEASLRTEQQTTFLDALLVTKFDGLAGRFSLVDGQLPVSAYEIVNIIGKGARTVGFWTPELGISTSLYPKSAGKVLKQILWPGETAAVPMGWNELPGGRPLQVAVPVKRGFKQFVEISGGPSIVTERVSGYCIDVFHAVMTRLNYPVAYSYVPVNDSMKSYDELVNLVHNKVSMGLILNIVSKSTHVVTFTMLLHLFFRKRESATSSASKRCI
jgi:ABC-type branched-subunit amino acid transport system substrate-binding protein